MKASETSLIAHAKGLCSDLQNASEDINLLFRRLDHKENLETENQCMLLKFGSQLDQNLKDLHRIVLGSVSQQQQELRIMEEHSQSFLAQKFEATRNLESRIENTADTFTSGIASLKDLAQILQKKVSSDLKKTNSSIGLQIESVEQFLTASAMEAAEVTRDLKNSLNDQKDLLALAARQQEQGLVKSMKSAQEICNTTSAIFSKIYNQAHDAVEAINASQAEKSRQLASFEKIFKEEAERDERQALEDISLILSKLTSKKTTMISDASRDIREHDIQDTKKLQERMAAMQEISFGAKEELCDYLKKAKTQFVENTIASAESITVMDNYLKDCLERTNESTKLWQKTETGVKNLNTKYNQELNVTTGDMEKENERLHGEIASTFSSMNAKFVTKTAELHKAINDLLMQDNENKETMDAISKTSMNQVILLQEKHGKAVSNIRNKAEESLIKDYQVDEHKEEIPKKQTIYVPSLASIEEMRTSFSQNLSKDCVNFEKILSKQEHEGADNRTPFSEVNM